jgi:hypothetical protein
MADFYVRWGDDVQPYVFQLGAEHIKALRLYCRKTIARLLRIRARRGAVVTVTLRVSRRMMNAKAFHRFEMFGFHFELRESPAKKGQRQEFVLSFSTYPDFEPHDMPPRLRRMEGRALSAAPTRKRRPRAAAPARAGTAGPASDKKRKVERQSYRISRLWIRPEAAALASSLAAKLYKMRASCQTLLAHLASMWRRRPRLAWPRIRVNFLTPLAEAESYAPTRARLELRLIGESLGLPLFTLVPAEPPIDWGACLFGERADEGERIPA